ncbi:hypothetical protein LUZ61_016351 [Rhynchospora tenuis]|uniref:BTB domain-containing protein n=1 Tax=Rhynchospora tenuis TaxID=198213 RepID=A0AAD5Z5C4_9POAL|nr:hypothetical protein LUZ61_016351 [Rhynchospora tenuis]
MMTSKSELAIGSHIFKITSYSSLIKEIDVGQYVSSSAFTVGGHEFYIRIYPQGVTKELKEFISVYLMLNSDAEELPVQFEFSFVDMSGDSVVVGQKISLSRIIESKGRGFGSSFKRTYLETSQYLKDDCFMVRCMVRVVRATEEEDRESLVSPSDLHLHLAKLLESGEVADVTFEVDKESFSAHRIVLAARSPVFEQLLCKKDHNDPTSCVRIEDVKAPVFKALLLYIYTDKLSNDFDEGEVDKDLTSFEFDQQLLLAADTYAIERLKFICEEKLCNKLLVDTVASTFHLAEKCKCNRLITACLKFAAKPENLISLMQMYSKISQGSEQHNTAGLSGLPELLNKLAHAFVPS